MQPVLAVSLVHLHSFLFCGSNAFPGFQLGLKLIFLTSLTFSRLLLLIFDLLLVFSSVCELPLTDDAKGAFDIGLYGLEYLEVLVALLDLL
jgi:hypothetical protein